MFWVYIYVFFFFKKAKPPTNIKNPPIFQDMHNFQQWICCQLIIINQHPLIFLVFLFILFLFYISNAVGRWVGYLCHPLRVNPRKILSENIHGFSNTMCTNCLNDFVYIILLYFGLYLNDKEFNVFILPHPFFFIYIFFSVYFSFFYPTLKS